MEKPNNMYRGYPASSASIVHYAFVKDETQLQARKERIRAKLSIRPLLTQIEEDPVAAAEHRLSQQAKESMDRNIAIIQMLDKTAGILRSRKLGPLDPHLDNLRSQFWAQFDDVVQ